VTKNKGFKLSLTNTEELTVSESKITRLLTIARRCFIVWACKPDFLNQNVTADYQQHLREVDHFIKG
tara:strand:- start:1126 stop:1326 length:201 start_codon:yes stop_codon:yes gene_type:complete